MTADLVRRPSSLDVYDTDAVRDWFMERVTEEVRAFGEPHPALILVGDGWVETLDLDAVARGQPDAHVGATLRLLRHRPAAERFFAIVNLLATRADGTPQSAAVIVEETVEDDTRRFWFGILPYETDPRSGIGRPGRWRVAETDDLDALQPPLRDLLDPPDTALPARVQPKRATGPALLAAIAELPDTTPVPADAVEQSDLFGALVVPTALREGIRGVWVVKQTGRRVEQWRLEADLPAPLDDIVRWLAGNAPAAEAIAVVVGGVFDGEAGPSKGLRIVAERGGTRAERWFLLDFPDGPAGRPVVVAVKWRRLPAPEDDDDRWLGVAPSAPLRFTPVEDEPEN